MEKEQIPKFEILNEEIGETKLWFAGGGISDCVSGYTISQRDGVWAPLEESAFESDGN